MKSKNTYYAVIRHYFQLFGKKRNIIIYLTIYKTYPSQSSKDSEDLIFVKILTRLTPHNYWLRSILISKKSCGGVIDFRIGSRILKIGGEILRGMCG